MSELARYESEKLGEHTLAIITMDDGKANSVSPAMIEAVNKALDQADKEQALVIFTGREGKFSAGFDLNVFQQGPEALADMLQGGAKLAQRLMSYPRPLVIACNGHALAMGALLLLTADYRIGALGNYKIGLNEVAIGLTMPLFGCEMARYSLTPQYYRRSVVNAEIFSPLDAVHAAYLDEVVDPDQLLKAARQKMESMSSLNMGAFKGTKMAARQQAMDALSAAVDSDFKKS